MSGDPRTGATYLVAAQHATRLADGRLEATIHTHGSSVELAEHWVPSDFEVGLELPYCKECFHGSGCRGPGRGRGSTPSR